VHILELGLRFGSTNLMFLVDLLFLLACLFLFICCKIKIKDNDDFILMERSVQRLSRFSVLDWNHLFVDRFGVSNIQIYYYSKQRRPFLNVYHNNPPLDLQVLRIQDFKRLVYTAITVPDNSE